MTDGIYKLLATWEQCLRTAVFMALFFLLLFAGISVALYTFKRSGLEIHTSSTGTSIQFTDMDRKVRFDTLLIHPQDWNDPHISVEKGDSVSVAAFGNVNVAAGLFIDALQKQYVFRNANASAGKSRDVRDMTPEQVSASLLQVPWNGPEGFAPNDVKDEKIKATQDREADTRIVPNERMGRLITAIVPGDSCPSQGRTASDMQLVPYTPNVAFRAHFSGKLCFIVNDHRSDKPELNELYWQDNIGLFSANVKVESVR